MTKMFETHGRQYFLVNQKRMVLLVDLILSMFIKLPPLKSMAIHESMMKACFCNPDSKSENKVLTSFQIMFEFLFFHSLVSISIFYFLWVILTIFNPFK